MLRILSDVTGLPRLGSRLPQPIRTRHESSNGCGSEGCSKERPEGEQIPSQVCALRLASRLRWFVESFEMSRPQNERLRRRLRSSRESRCTSRPATCRRRAVIRLGARSPSMDPSSVEGCSRFATRSKLGESRRPPVTDHANGRWCSTSANSLSWFFAHTKSRARSISCLRNRPPLGSSNTPG